MRRFCVENLPTPEQEFVLTGDEARHLTQVLRCKPNDVIQLFDGQGRSVECRVLSCGVLNATLQPLNEPSSQAVTSEKILCLAQIKPKALDNSIRMATEIGITQIVIFVAQRSIARVERLERWKRLTTAAAKQCGRNDLPNVCWQKNSAGLFESIADSVNNRFIALPGVTTKTNFNGSSAIVVGPEGGFSPEERTHFAQRDFLPVGLGPWTLRADTAASLAAAYISSRF